ncbi:hypothetical protein YPPY66_1266, partial [Yersinia pestis PY-66]
MFTRKSRRCTINRWVIFTLKNNLHIVLTCRSRFIYIGNSRQVPLINFN